MALPGLAAAADKTDRHADAVKVLKHAKNLRNGHASQPTRELTPTLAELARKRQYLGSDGRRQVDSLLARPTDVSEDPPGHAYSAPEGPALCGTHFCIHWVTSGPDAPFDVAGPDANSNGRPDSIDDMLAALENEVYPCENTAGSTACNGTDPGLGWPDAPSDGTNGNTAGASGKFDVYVEELYDVGLYGYVAPDSTQDLNADDSWESYLVLDRRFDRYNPSITGPEAMRATAAHEYNHVLQLGLDGWNSGNSWMFESTAVYVEEVVYPAINDYVPNYMYVWAHSTADPLTATDGGGSYDPQAAGLKKYGSAVWNFWLATQYGRDTILNAWKAKNRPDPHASFAPGSYGAAITAKGGSGFQTEFARFAASTAEWRVPSAGYPDLYPEVERLGTLTVGGAPFATQLDHTTFKLLGPIATSSPVVSVSATLPPGLNGAIALVGRTGPSDTAGDVTTSITPLPSGGTGNVSLLNANTFGRITAVLVNADISHNAFDWDTLEWPYIRDNATFSAVKAFIGPAATTKPADTVTFNGANLRAIVEPLGVSTDWHFEWGRDASYGNSTPGGNLAADTLQHSVTDRIEGLDPTTSYHFRVVATDANGNTNYGADQIFTTSAPVVQIGGNNFVVPPKLLVLTATVGKGKLRTILKRGLRVRAGCGQPCTLTFKLVVPKKTAKKFKLKRATVATAQATVGTAGDVTMVRFTKAAKKALRRAKTLKATLTVSALDRAAGKISITKPVSLKR